MHITMTLAPLVSLLAGILILVVPRLLSSIVGIYWHLSKQGKSS